MGESRIGRRWSKVGKSGLEGQGQPAPEALLGIYRKIAEIGLIGDQVTYQEVN